MTLEEVIGFFDRDKGGEFLPHEVKEIYDCLVNLQGLEVYKKALELACEQITYLNCDGSCDLFKDCKFPCTTLDCIQYDTWVDFYLKKAGEE